MQKRNKIGLFFSVVVLFFLICSAAIAADSQVIQLDPRLNSLENQVQELNKVVKDQNSISNYQNQLEKSHDTINQYIGLMQIFSGAFTLIVTALLGFLGIMGFQAYGTNKKLLDIENNAKIRLDHISLTQSQIAAASENLEKNLEQSQRDVSKISLLMEQMDKVKDDFEIKAKSISLYIKDLGTIVKEFSEHKNVQLLDQSIKTLADEADVFMKEVVKDTNNEYISKGEKVEEEILGIEIIDLGDSQKDKF